MRVVAALFMLSIAQLWLYQTAALAFFEANRTYIAEVFCVNKDKPELDCRGQCHLKDMLEAGSKNSEQAPVIPEAEHLLLFFLETFLPDINRVSFIQTKSPVYFGANLLIGYRFQNWHPPKFWVFTSPVHTDV